MFRIGACLASEILSELLDDVLVSVDQRGRQCFRRRERIVLVHDLIDLVRVHPYGHLCF